MAHANRVLPGSLAFAAAAALFYKRNSNTTDIVGPETSPETIPPPTATFSTPLEPLDHTANVALNARPEIDLLSEMETSSLFLLNLIPVFLMVLASISHLSDHFRIILAVVAKIYGYAFCLSPVISTLFSDGSCWAPLFFVVLGALVGTFATKVWPGVGASLEAKPERSAAEDYTHMRKKAIKLKVDSRRLQKELDATKDELIMSNRVLNDERDSLLEETEQQSQTITSLRKELDDHEKQRRVDKDAARNTIRERDLLLKKTERQSQTITSLREDLNNHSNQSRLDEDAARNTICELEIQDYKLRDRLRFLETRKVHWHQDRQDLEAAVSHAKELEHQLQSYKTLEAEHKSMKSALANAKRELTASKVQTDILEEAVSSQQAAHSVTLETRKQEFDTALQNSEDRGTRLSDEIKSLDRQIEVYKNDSKVKDLELKASADCVESLEQATANKTTLLDIAHETIIKSKSDLCSQSSLYEKRISDLEQQLKSLQNIQDTDGPEVTQSNLELDVTETDIPDQIPTHHNASRDGIVEPSTTAAGEQEIPMNGIGQDGSHVHNGSQSDTIDDLDPVCEKPEKVKDNVVALDDSDRASQILTTDAAEQAISISPSFSFNTKSMDFCTSFLSKSLATTTTATITKAFQAKSRRARRSPIESKVDKRTARQQIYTSSTEEGYEYDSNGVPKNPREGKQPSRAVHEDGEILWAHVPDASAPIQLVVAPMELLPEPQPMEVMTEALNPAQESKTTFSFSNSALQSAPFTFDTRSAPAQYEDRKQETVVHSERAQAVETMSQEDTPMRDTVLGISDPDRDIVLGASVSGAQSESRTSAAAFARDVICNNASGLVLPGLKPLVIPPPYGEQEGKISERSEQVSTVATCFQKDAIMNDAEPGSPAPDDNMIHDDADLITQPMPRRILDPASVRKRLERERDEMALEKALQEEFAKSDAEEAAAAIKIEDDDEQWENFPALAASTMPHGAQAMPGSSEHSHQSDTDDEMGESNSSEDSLTSSPPAMPLGVVTAQDEPAAPAQSELEKAVEVARNEVDALFKHHANEIPGADPDRQRWDKDISAVEELERIAEKISKKFGLKEYERKLASVLRKYEIIGNEIKRDLDRLAALEEAGKDEERSSDLNRLDAEADEDSDEEEDSLDDLDRLDEVDDEDEDPSSDLDQLDADANIDSWGQPLTAARDSSDEQESTYQSDQVKKALTAAREVTENLMAEHLALGGVSAAPAQRKWSDEMAALVKKAKKLDPANVQEGEREPEDEGYADDLREVLKMEKQLAASIRGAIAALRNVQANIDPALL